MQATCPKCSTSYFVDDDKIPEQGGQLSCPGCGTEWTIFRASSPDPAGGSPARGPTLEARPAAKGAGSPVTCPKCGHKFHPSATRRAATGSRRKLVLLVEDQQYFTELAKDALGKDYRTLSVATKDEALMVIEKDPPSLIILDLSLARGQDGRELLRAIPGKEFPILIFTARDESEIFEEWPELQNLGASDIVRKSMNVGEELKKKVAELLGD
jgi:predicted Zn finger-like uncharacterized protein